MRLRPAAIPFYWQKITCGCGIAHYLQKRDWQLVLSAKNIPFRIFTYNGQSHIYVPLLQAEKAKREIACYEAENAVDSSETPVFPPHKNGCAALLPLAFPIIIHILNSPMHALGHGLPAPGAWTANGCLSAADILGQGQWYRIFTALTLHVDLRHLAGNLLFGGLFLALLGRLIGPGLAILSAVLAGAAGNAASVLIHLPGYRSVGFSTAIFASLGCMAGVMFWRSGKRLQILPPLGAAFGLLALLGAEGKNTDYGAHLTGLAAGLVLGLLLGYRETCRLWLPSQKMAALMGISILCLAWILAFL